MQNLQILVLGMEVTFIVEWRSMALASRVMERTGHRSGSVRVFISKGGDWWWVAGGALDHSIFLLWN